MLLTGVMCTTFFFIHVFIISTYWALCTTLKQIKDEQDTNLACEFMDYLRRQK